MLFDALLTPTKRGAALLLAASLMGCPTPVATTDAAGSDAGDRVDARSIDVDAGTSTDARLSDARPSDASPSDAPMPDAFGAVSISMNAVSVLFALPPRPSLEGLLALDAAGRGGPLLPREVFDAIPVFEGGTRGGAYDTWRIVAARIDPCFPAHALLTTNPAACRRQLRLVAQPNVQDGSFANDDHGIHLLYDLTEAEFNDLAARWVAPLMNEPGARTQPLDVSPRMRSEGLAGPYATGLRSLILEFAGQATLSQVTFMLGLRAAWKFGGFHIRSGTRTDLEIAGLRVTSGMGTSFEQMVTSNNDAPFSFAPISDVTEGLMPLAGELDDPSIMSDGRWHLGSTPAARRVALQLSFDIDDPHGRFDPDNLDCASCHAAGRARNRAVRGGETLDGLTHYTHPTRPLRVPTGAPHDALLVQRAFGYLNQRAAVMPRTVNESAEVADWVERLLTR